MKYPFSFLLPVVLLGGCSGASETASYSVNSEQAFTLVRQRAYPWDDEYMRAVVVMSKPKCLLRYKMPPDNGEVGNVKVYDGGDGYYVLKDKAGQYMANLADCSMSVVEKPILDPGEFKGTFEMALDHPPRFVAAPTKPQPRAQANPAGGVPTDR